MSQILLRPTLDDLRLTGRRKLSDLPSDILLRVLGMLPVMDILRVERVRSFISSMASDQILADSIQLSIAGLQDIEISSCYSSSMAHESAVARPALCSQSSTIRRRLPAVLRGTPFYCDEDHAVVRSVQEGTGRE